MSFGRRLVVALGTCAWATGCAFVPSPSPRLDEAHAAYAQAQAVPHVACLAPAQLAEAAKALERADHAHNTLDDPAHVDHLAYIAMRRAMIAREAARRAGARRWDCQ